MDNVKGCLFITATIIARYDRENKGYESSILQVETDGDYPQCYDIELMSDEQKAIIFNDGDVLDLLIWVNGTKREKLWGPGKKAFTNLKLKEFEIVSGSPAASVPAGQNVEPPVEEDDLDSLPF